MNLNVRVDVQRDCDGQEEAGRSGLELIPATAKRSLSRVDAVLPRGS